MGDAHHSKATGVEACESHALTISFKRGVVEEVEAQVIDGGQLVTI